MKSLATIQKIAKAGRILSKIVFICSIVGAAGCLLGIVAFAVIPDGFKIGELTLHGLIEKNAEMSIGTAYASMATGMIICGGEIALARIAELYFKRELAAGTPFTFAGAKELKRLGFCAIFIPLGTSVLAGIAYAVIKAVFENVAELKSGFTFSIGLGIMFLVMSVICKYGAELEAERTMNVDPVDPE